MQNLTKLAVAAAAILLSADASAQFNDVRTFVGEIHRIERAFGRELGRPNNGDRIKSVAIDQRSSAGELSRIADKAPVPDNCKEAAHWLHLLLQRFLTPSRDAASLEMSHLRFRRFIKDCEIETGIRQDRQFRF